MHVGLSSKIIAALYFLTLFGCSVSAQENIAFTTKEAAVVSDLTKWKVHGPVKTLRSEFAAWDQHRQDWQAVEHVRVASFYPDGAISTTDSINPDGSIVHSRWMRDEAGRTIELQSWMNDGPIARTVYVYDEVGRLIRTSSLDPDGTPTDVEVDSYDSNGRRTKVRRLPPTAAAAKCTEGNCVAATSYSIEGTDSAYGAPGATTMTINYDEKNLPTKVTFHDADHRLLSYVALMRDGEGRLISEEFHQETSPFQNFVNEKAPPEEREQLAALFTKVFADRFSSTTYKYDARGRLTAVEHRMGNLGGDITTYRYDEHDDPIEGTTENMNREASFDDAGNIKYSSDRINVQHSQFEYLYDAHGNWTERIVSIRSEAEPTFQRSNIERRTINYYPTN